MKIQIDVSYREDGCYIINAINGVGVEYSELLNKTCVDEELTEEIEKIKRAVSLATKQLLIDLEEDLYEHFLGGC